MAQRSYRASLSTSQYPFRLRQIGEAVMMSGIDAATTTRTSVGDTVKAASGIPQLIHAINILPTLGGYASVKSVARHTDTAVLGTNEIISPDYVDMYDSDGTRLKVFLWGQYVSSDAYYPGLFFVSPTGYSRKFTMTTSTTVSSATLLAQELTCGFAQGRQYYYTAWSGLALLVGSIAANNLSGLNGITMTGLEQTGIRGIVVAAGFIVAFADWAAAWSTTLTLVPESWVASTAYDTTGTLVTPTAPTVSRQFSLTTAGTSGSTEPSWNTTIGATTSDGSCVWTCEALAVDFTPSTTTGAGGGNIEELRGPIMTCKEVSSGFIAYTSNNCVYCGYTGNYSYPFTFKNISGSSGIVNRGCVTGSSSGSMHYVVGRSGVQQVTALGTKTICDPLSEVLQDVLVDRYSLNYDSSAGTFTQAHSTIASLITHIEFVADRYLCVLRGATSNHVIDVYIYDTILERYGKLDCDCLTVFTCTVDNDSYVGKSGSCLGLIDLQGNRFALTPDDLADTSTMVSLALFGPYKFIRDQWVNIQAIRMAVGLAANVVVPIPLGDDGEQLYGATAAYHITATGGQREVYYCDCEGDSVLVAVIGRFNLASLTLTFTSGGHM